ncbi:phosphoethanolamine transferase [Arenimonas donghaensis]|uniref:Sulfatase N-terminal domain-containing protein n=1 Tax=Arenimonas donghaensis DSM 18148 = HO3-R19 TaxID=1121014 RepID=A0A087MM17_9GAMM|nr:phosphoethanolamine--lipid A transferase [Arenimonas donghaensis]KFL37920.1 hypothetical protein N788_01745 [Arenimonas donghaensis DSM 18148 = HO3-R19]
MDTIGSAFPTTPGVWRFFRWRPSISLETFALVAAALFTLFYNNAFWRFLAARVDLHQGRGWAVAAAFAIVVWGLHALLLLVLLARWNAKLIVGLMIVVSAIAVYYMGEYAVFLDVDMLRNVLHSEPKEAAELVTPGLAWTLALYAAVPLALLARVRWVERPWLVALGRRAVVMTVVSCLLLGASLATFQDMASLMRNHKPMRYLVTPGNWIASLARVAGDAVSSANKPHIPVGTDAVLATPAGGRPRLLVIVVGETVRARNWGLSGYARNTTPMLARRDVVNFTDVTACGTSTEVSLPCMFAQRGRRDYDKGAIARSDSLLQVLDHAGVAVAWRDNQTGCKGVCNGLPFESFLHADIAGLCDGERCLDEVLLHDLQARLAEAEAAQVIVLHQLGNHGPSYYRRYPPAFERFTPACHDAQLGDCTSQEVVNAYDNAILYTDYFLATTIDFLEAQEGRDTALIYVSDHGESLGEANLYLHGVPYPIAPDVQTKVPMLVWLSPGLREAEGLSQACLLGRRNQPLSHDNLFSSVLGLMDVSTQDYEPGLDLFRPCRPT